MMQTKTKLALAAFLTIGLNTAVYSQDNSATSNDAPAVAEIVADPSVTECAEASAPIIPDGNVASKDELLAAQKAFKVFELSTQEYRDCLLVLKANIEAMDLEPSELESKLANNLAADNASVDKVEFVAEEFNKAVRAFKAK